MKAGEKVSDTGVAEGPLGEVYGQMRLGSEPKESETKMLHHSSLSESGYDRRSVQGGRDFGRFAYFWFSLPGK